MSERQNRDAISNYFDAILDGCCPYVKRGGAFCDLDAATLDTGRAFVVDDNETAAFAEGAYISHNDHVKPNRFLVQEFKHQGDASNTGQDRLLTGLAHVHGFTVWRVWRRLDGRVEWYDVRQSDVPEVITVAEYRLRVARWWKLDAPFRDPDPALLLKHGITWNPAGTRRDDGEAPNAGITDRHIRWNTAMSDDEFTLTPPAVDAAPRSATREGDDKAAAHRRKTLDVMHRRHGVAPAGVLCSGCAFLVRSGGGDGSFLKCKAFRISCSTATDWRYRWPACGKFERRVEEAPPS